MQKHFWERKIKGRVGFSKEDLKTAVTFLKENFDFNVCNITMKQMIGIPVEIYHIPSFYILMKKNTCHFLFHATRFKLDISSVQNILLVIFMQ